MARSQKDLREVHANIIANREFKVLPRKFFHTGTWEKWSFPRRRHMEKLLCIHGTGRSGTLWLTRLFKTAGVDLGHECVKQHGTVTHYFYLDADWYPASPDTGKMHVGERRTDFVFEHEWHITRDPLKTIPSIASIFLRLEYEWLLDHSVLTSEEYNWLDRLQRAALIWCRINEQIDSISPSRWMQIENLKTHWPSLLETLKVPVVPWPDLPPGHKSSGYRKAIPIKNRSELRDKVGVDLAQRVVELGRRYGYKI